MRVLTAISRWTNPNSNKVYHIPVPNEITRSVPLCGWRKGVSGYSWSEGKPTCKKCLRMAAQK